MGVLSDAGMLNLIAEKILDSKMAGTARGAELVCMMGIAFTTILLGGVTSASILTFGPILNKIGAARNIHPYRRANLLGRNGKQSSGDHPVHERVRIHRIRIDRSFPGHRCGRNDLRICPVLCIPWSCPYGMGMPERRIGSGFPDLDHESS